MNKPFFSFLLLCSLVVHGQQEQAIIDSLKMELTTTTDYREQIDINRNIGFVFIDNQMHYDSAMYYAKKAYLIAKEHNFILEQAQTLFDQAMVFEGVDDYHKAIDYYLQSLEFSMQGTSADSERGVLITYNNLGDLYASLEDFENAKKYHQLVIGRASELGIPILEAANLANMGEIYHKEGDLPKAFDAMFKSKQKAKEIGMEEPRILLNLAEIYRENDEVDKAIIETKDALDMAKRTRNLESIYNSSSFLSSLYAEKENYKDSNELLKQALTYKDSIVSKTESNKVEKVELKFQLKEQETALQNLEEKTKYLNTIYVLAAIGVLLLVILVMRQLKIVRMTRNIHEIQNSLIKSEMEHRKLNPTSYQATLEADKELSDTD